MYRYLAYTLTLEAPAIITKLGGDPNSSITATFIPGSAIRGAVAASLGDPGNDAQKQEVFRDLVLGRKVRYLHAYPAYEERRTLPMPLSLQKKKEDGDKKDGEVYDLAAYCDPEEFPEEQLKRLDGQFLTIGLDELVCVSTKQSARLHHQREREKGRASKDKDGTHGAIFAFEAIDAGESFCGMIQICADSESELNELEERIKGSLGKTIFVGRSRMSGYGGVAEIKWLNSKKREVESGSDHFKPLNNDIKTGGLFRVLLASACVMRHAETGQIDPEYLKTFLQERLDAKLVCTQWSFETIGGFNRKWRLEMPQVLAASAGSVLVLQAEKDIPFNTLQEIEHAGIGERRAEGYGRVVFLNSPIQTLTLTTPKESKKEDVKKGMPPDLVKKIERRILKAQIQRNIESCALTLAKSAERIPSNSLIGRLRTPLRADSKTAINTLKDWLGEDKNKCLKRPAMEQLEQCRLEQTNLKEWIRKTFDEEYISKELDINTITQNYYISSENDAKKVFQEAIPEFSVKLIDAVLAAMAVRNRKGSDSEQR